MSEWRFLGPFKEVEWTQEEKPEQKSKDTIKNLFLFYIKLPVINKAR